MNPNFNAFISSVRYLLVVIGTIMAEQGLDHTTTYKWVVVSSGAIMIIGPAIWGVWSSIYNWYKAAAVGAQAGMNMVLQGKALAQDGTTVTSIGDGTTPLKQVTVATTKEIVKDFPPDAPIAKS